MFGKSKISIIKSAYSIKQHKIQHRFDFDFRMEFLVFALGMRTKQNKTPLNLWHETKCFCNFVGFHCQSFIEIIVFFFFYGSLLIKLLHCLFGDDYQIFRVLFRNKISCVFILPAVNILRGFTVAQFGAANFLLTRFEDEA